MEIKWRFFFSKIIGIGPHFLTLLENVTGVHFFETQCILTCRNTELTRQSLPSCMFLRLAIFVGDVYDKTTVASAVYKIFIVNDK